MSFATPVIIRIVRRAINFPSRNVLIYVKSENPKLVLTEGNRFPVERPDFKSGEMRLACLVGSTPAPFRPIILRSPPGARVRNPTLSRGLGIFVRCPNIVIVPFGRFDKIETMSNIKSI